MFNRKNTLIIIIQIIFFSLLVFLAGCSNDYHTYAENKTIITGQVVFNTTTADHQISTQNAQLNSNTYKSNNISNLNSVKKVEINTMPIQSAASKDNKFILKIKDKFSLSTQKIESEILLSRGQVNRQITPSSYEITINSSQGQLLEQLKENEVVQYIEPNYQTYIQAVPSDPGYPKQWNLEMLNLDRTWGEYKGSRDITVAVIDTGILPEHPDLKDNLIDGYDFIDDNDDPRDPDPEFSHGTHVAGIIGAVTDNNKGIAGINWEVSIMPIRVIGLGGSGDYSALISGIYWAVDNGADIINLSLAGPVSSEGLKDAVNYAYSNNVTIIAAAGNSGTTPILYPARYPEVISVGAVGPDGKRAYYSNYGPELDLLAPGGDDSNNKWENPTILSTAGYLSSNGPVYQYTWAQGTSMAAPHAAGAAALLYSSGINNPQEIRDILEASADNQEIEGENHEYGAGLININRALGIEENESEENNKTEFPDDIQPEKTLITAENIDQSSNENIITTTADKNGRFKFQLSPGVWNITAVYEQNEKQYKGACEEIKISRGSSSINLELTLNMNYDS